LKESRSARRITLKSFRRSTIISIECPRWWRVTC
ncbi:hypothetical protein T08_2221, partial [Trichinella sp. T8]